MTRCAAQGVQAEVAAPGTVIDLGAARVRRLLAGAINARPQELAGALAAFATAFTMFSAYAILRPIRETMGITSGVQTLPALFWGTFAGMLLVQPVYGWLTSRYRRSAFLPWVYLFFVLNILGFHAWFNAAGGPHLDRARLLRLGQHLRAVRGGRVLEPDGRRVQPRAGGTPVRVRGGGPQHGRPVRPVPRRAARRADRHDQPAAGLGGAARRVARLPAAGAALAPSARREHRAAARIATSASAARRSRRSGRC